MREALAIHPCLEGTKSHFGQATGLAARETPRADHRCGTVPGSHRTSLGRNVSTIADSVNLTLRKRGRGLPVDEQVVVASPP